MVRFRMLAAIVAAGAATSWLATPSLAGVNLTLFPNSPGVSNVAGNSGTSAPGFGTGSFQAAAPGAGTKSEIYISASSLFSTPVTIADIASISYFTNKGGTSAAVDWTFLIYTQKQNDGGDSGSFYDSRLNSEPYFSQTPSGSAPPNTWNEWASGGSNPMRFYDQIRSNSFGTYTDPTLSNLTAGSVTWNGSGQSGVSHDYRSEVVSLFSFQTGSAWANGFAGLLDGFTITLKSGDTSTVNFEAVATPEPATLVSAGFAVVAGLGFAAMRRRKAKASV